MGSSIHSDKTATVRISARRFEPSPYAEFYTKPESVVGVVAGRYYEVSNGEDPEAFYWILRRQAVLYDVPEKPWQIDGPDALPFLEKIFARPVGTLTEGRGRYAIACTADGGTFMDGILFRLAENRYWYVQPEGALEPWLTAHSDGFDVRISDPKSRVLQLQGPNSFKIMAAASDGAIDEKLKYFQSGYYDLGGQRLYVSRTGWTGELGYEIYSDGANTDYAQLWQHLAEAGIPHGMVYGSLASMEIRRIEAGILDNLTDFDTTMNPFEAGLGEFIDLDKPGFIGREALIQSNRQPLLYGVKCRTTSPHFRGEIFDGPDAVAWVTAGVWSPYLECGIGYVRFERPGDWAGKTLSMQTEAGDLAPCEIIALPFYDAEKRIPRANGAMPEFIEKK